MIPGTWSHVSLLALLIFISIGIAYLAITEVRKSKLRRWRHMRRDVRRWR